MFIIFWRSVIGLIGSPADAPARIIPEIPDFI